MSGSDDGMIRVWDINKKQQISTFGKNRGRFYSMVFSPDRRTLASYSPDNTVRIWDIAAGTLLQTITGHNTMAVKFTAYSSHGRTLACLSITGDFQLWDPNTTTLLKSFEIELNRISCAAYSPDNVTFACGNEYGALAIFDADTGAQNHTIMDAHTDHITAVAFSPDGGILASCGYDQVIHLWSVHTGVLKDILVGHEQRVRDLTFSPSGEILASASSDGKIRFWDVSTGETVKIIETFGGRIDKVAFSPSGDVLVSSGRDAPIAFWDVSTGAHLKSITPPANHVFYRFFTRWTDLSKLTPERNQLLGYRDRKTYENP